MRIPFKKAYYDDTEIQCVKDALVNNTDYISKVQQALTAHFDGASVFLTSSASAAFDLLFAALDFELDSEIIMPSFTYPSAANSALRYGSKPIFADIDETMVVDIDDVRRKITGKTACIIPTHYGGASVDLDALKPLCKDAFIIEDAALSFGAKYKDNFLGGIGDFGIMSFHHTKNISADQGGLLIINPKHERIAEAIEVLYDNGTNKADFVKGNLSEYSWQSAGLGVSMPNTNAAVLYAQLKKGDEILAKQKRIWNYYNDIFKKIEGVLTPVLEPYNQNNYHVFYLVFNDFEKRENVRRHLEKKGIDAYFHYIPLHSSKMGLSLGYSKSDMPNTKRVSECILRLPIFAGLTQQEIDMVVNCVLEAIQ